MVINKKNKALLFFILVVNVLIIQGAQVYAQGTQGEYSVSGIISLPNSEVAPTGGINLNINVDTRSDAGIISEPMTIAAGQSSVAYSVDVPQETSDEWVVSYTCSNCDGYVQKGYYATMGTRVRVGLLLTGEQNHTNIDFQLLVANSISGTVSLPNGMVAPAGGISIDLEAHNDYGDLRSVDHVIIADGQSSASYSIDVPQPASYEWFVKYSCSDCDGYVKQGYYTSTTTQLYRDTDEFLTGGQNLPMLACS